MSSEFLPTEWIVPPVPTTTTFGSPVLCSAGSRTVAALFMVAPHVSFAWRPDGGVKREGFTGAVTGVACRGENLAAPQGKGPTRTPSEVGVSGQESVPAA